jgi:hypothetical protein
MGTINCKGPGARMMMISPEDAHAIIYTDYLRWVKHMQLNRDQRQYCDEVLGYADEMRAGTFVIRDRENYMPVPKEGLSGRVGNRRLWAIIQSGVTTEVPMNAEYINFTEVYQKELAELPIFLNSFFDINLVDLDFLKRVK